ncbi:hypothetical protein BBD39_07325 [Arsenophonus endosymbiont of Bemisia tabaci Asia II 3]|nr:hypothetical protein BBD39_07325 [Arsenophonus endosymbiont of Bemisia tabaci Asia II 3]
MMKKYLKSIKKLQLAKSILVGSIFLICSSSALAWFSFSDNETKYSGIVSNVSFQKSGTTCSITVDKNPAISSDRKHICDFANEAKESNRKVSLYSHQIGHFLGEDESYHVSAIGFADIKAQTVSVEKENVRFKYMLQGKVENVIYSKAHGDLHTTDHCHIAINGPAVRNNLKYHDSLDMNICRLAKDAFYTGMQVRMIATADNTRRGWPNKIDSFQVTQCCTRSQRN